MRNLLFAAASACLSVGSAVGDPLVQPITQQDVQERTHWLIPLPKQVEFTGKLRVAVSRLAILLPNPPTELDQCAAQELRALIRDATGVEVLGTTARVPRGSFVIQLARTESSRRVLSQLRNADQAYLIEALRDSGRRIRGLLCGGITEVGTYYAMKTLKQLLGPMLKGKGPDAAVDIPVVKIVDWPDLEERGEWGGSAYEDLERMADRKFNLIERHAALTVDDKGIGHATMDPPASTGPKVMDRAGKHAVRIVPIIHHLEQLEETGIFKAFPQIKAVGAENGNCFSRPEVVTLLSQWLTDLGRTSRVSDVMIWLSEEGQGCTCEGCRKDDRFVNEMRSCVAAWEAAKKDCPNLGLRLLLTQASYNSNGKILAAVPEGVKVSYYHGGLTYDTSRRPMIYPLLEQYAKKGRWLGVYPTLGANWLIVGPFSNPQFVHFRMTEFVDKGLHCLVGYIVPSNWYYPVNVEAAAEWSWNAHGRSPEEFAVAYAVRHGIKDPGKFARWAETLSPVSWDLYASRFPFLERYNHDADRVAGGYVKRSLGTSIFEAFKSEAQFDEDLAQCDAALALANEIADEGSILETKIIQGYVRVLKAIWQLSKLVHGDKGINEADRDAVKKLFDLFAEGNNAVTSLYPRWSEVLAAQFKGAEPQRFLDTVHLMDLLAGRMGTLMERCGFEDKDKPYRIHLVGEWKTEDFEEQQSQRRRLDVTEFVDGAGTYTLQPKWRSGTLGLTATRVSLVSFSKAKPEDVKEEATDKHDCHAGAWVKGDVYTLELGQYDPNRGYAVIADIYGGKTTGGEFYFRKLRTSGK